jgi:hypothetical protein
MSKRSEILNGLEKEFNRKLQDLYDRICDVQAKCITLESRVRDLEGEKELLNRFAEKMELKASKVHVAKMTSEQIAAVAEAASVAIRGHLGNGE